MTYPDVFHNKIIDDQCIAACTDAETDGWEIFVESDRVGPFSSSVGEGKDLWKFL